MNGFVKTGKRQLPLKADIVSSYRKNKSDLLLLNSSGYNIVKKAWLLSKVRYPKQRCSFPTQQTKKFFCSIEFSIFENIFKNELCSLSLHFRLRLQNPMTFLSLAYATGNTQAGVFIFRSFHITPFCSSPVKVSGRDEKEVVRYVSP